MGNAIKYTPVDGVILRVMPGQQETVSQKDHAGQIEAEKIQVRFEVEDTGIGIDKEDQDRIFEPFVQLDGRPTTERGTGLGLIISKQNVEFLCALLQGRGRHRYDFGVGKKNRINI